MTVALELQVEDKWRGAEGEADPSTHATTETVRDERVIRFGLREVGTAGTQITLNGRPIRPERRPDVASRRFQPMEPIPTTSRPAVTAR